jgi:deoxyhypusine synthase
MGSCYIDDKALRPKEFIKIYESLENKNDLTELDNKIKEYLENN